MQAPSDGDDDQQEAHDCEANAPFAKWFTEHHPYRVSSSYPHPSLLALHYGVFVAQNFGSKELKHVALGSKRRPAGGGNHGGGDVGGPDGTGGGGGEDDEGHPPKRKRPADNEDSDTLGNGSGSVTGTSSSRSSAPPAPFKSVHRGEEHGEGARLGGVPLTWSGGGSESNSVSGVGSGASNSGLFLASVQSSITSELVSSDTMESGVDELSLDLRRQVEAKEDEEESEEDEEDERHALERVKWFHFIMNRHVSLMERAAS
ncbi:hypothetical protein DFH07DRAFT_803686 [Mycena maculata]|uniref:Uncharacterized protein n=1 Tax=Mycena maculata TaxID=230809 RepID=A0AAD7JYN9_9AGAR|nr:hypothetical protein DFH07DRAFT_803686 [Mycena maculata]